MPLISFCIPVFRNEGSLKITYDRIRDIFEGELSEHDFEIVFTNDGSDDGSMDEMLALREQDKRVRIFDLSRNFGQRYSLLCSFDNCKGDAAILMAADLQEPFEKISEMVNLWDQGNEMVICYRADRKDHWLDGLFSRTFYKIVRSGIPNMPKGGFDFMLMDRKGVDQFNQITYRNNFFQGDVLSLGFKTVFIPYTRLARTIGKSQQPFGRRVRYFVDGLISASYVPIRFMSVIGFAVFLIGLVYGGFNFVYRLLDTESEWTGWTSLIISVWLLSGIIMVMLGVIGEYIWRINDEVKGRQRYIIGKKYDD